MACASRNAKVEGVANFPDLAAMLAGVPELDCVSICTPPQAHFDAALSALRAGKHVMLEKPPTATTRQIALLADEAARHGRTLFQTWHSRFAASVDAARDWLRTRKLTGGKITWKEDVHHWHPGQHWIWEPGGFGVFDPGINALVLADGSAVAKKCASKARCSNSRRTSRRRSRRTWRMRTTAGVAIAAEFDFRQKGEQSWDIELTTTDGTLKLSRGGAALEIDGKTRGERSRPGGRVSASVRALCRARAPRGEIRSRLAAVSTGRRRLPDRRAAHRRASRDLRRGSIDPPPRSRGPPLSN